MSDMQYRTMMVFNDKAFEIKNSICDRETTKRFLAACAETNPLTIELENGNIFALSSQSKAEVYFIASPIDNE